MRFTTLDDWLRWQETLHPQVIELGLERVRTVTERVIREQRTILAGPAGDAAALDAVGLCLFNQSVDLANGDPVRLCPGPAAGLPAADAADGGSP